MLCDSYNLQHNQQYQQRPTTQLKSTQQQQHYHLNIDGNNNLNINDDTNQALLATTT